MREAEKQCALVQREREVLRALESLNSSYSDIETVDARCMPYVSTPASYQYAPQQSAEDAAKWLIGWKNRQETRHKLLMAEIEARSSRCKGCRARYDYRSVYTVVIDQARGPYTVMIRFSALLPNKRPPSNVFLSMSAPILISDPIPHSFQMRDQLKKPAFYNTIESLLQVISYLFKHFQTLRHFLFF